MALALTACSVLLDYNAKQCTQTADCASFGKGFTCSGTVCVASAIVDAGATDAGATTKACATNIECLTASAGTNTPQICRKDADGGTCVPVLTGGDGVCPLLVPAGAEKDQLRSDDVFLFAAFLPLANVSSPLAGPYALDYQLAISEINAAGGIVSGTGGKRHPVAAVFCESAPATAQQGVQFVTGTLKLPAIVAGLSQLDVTKSVLDYTLAADTFTLNPGDTTVALQGANVNRLLWNLLGTPDDVAVAYKPLLAKVEAYARNRKSQTTAPIKVALITTQAQTEVSVSEVVQDPAKGIVFNGKNTTDNKTDGNFLSLSLPSRTTAPTTSYVAAVAQLAAFKPDVVVALTGEQTELGAFVEPLETALAGDGGVAALPLWVLSLRNSRATDVLTYLGSSTIQSSKDKLPRFLGVEYAGADDSTQRDAWFTRMQAAYPGIDSTLYANTENVYDAIYWLAYGLYAAGPGAPLTGDSVKAGVRNLLSGPAINPGTTELISAGFRALSSGTATFVGALGTPTIDPGTGTPKSVGSVYCYAPVSGGSAIAPRYDVLRYNPTTSALDATKNSLCFLF